MAIDFNRLRDPKVQAQMRAAMEAEEQQLQAHEAELKGLVEKCLAADDRLSGRELELVMSCRRRLRTLVPLTAPQEKWLRDIAARH